MSDIWAGFTRNRGFDQTPISEPFRGVYPPNPSRFVPGGMVRRGDERAQNGSQRLRIEAAKPPILYQMPESTGSAESGSLDGSGGGFMVTCDKPVSVAIPDRRPRWKTMTTQNDSERQLRIAYKQLADETSESHALDVLDDIQSEALDPATDVVADEAATDGGQQQSEFSHEFDVDERRMLDDQQTADLKGIKLVEQTLGTVRVLAREDGLLVLGGDTYDAKGVIKGAVDYADRAFEDSFAGYDKVWTVSEDVVDDLHTALNNTGYLLVGPTDEADEGEEPEVPVAEVLDDFADLVDEGDRIRVTYAQKNGNGYNEKEGVVTRKDLPDDEYVDATQLVFVRDDDQTMYVDVDYQYDDTLRLRTSMSHAPFVGDVVWLEVLR